MKASNVTALVTGGASGLGLAITQKVLEHGGKVVICDIRRSKDVDVLKGDFIFSETDITSEESIQKAIDFAISKFGSINCVVNCAGIDAVHKLIDVEANKTHDLGVFERVLKVNVVGTFNVIRLTALAMAKNTPGEGGERGVIVNTASITAFEGAPGQVAYATSKAAVVGMTLPVARELAKHGIRCVAVAPGAFGTQMVQSAPSEAISKLVSKTPFPRRLGRPSEFVDLVFSIVENQMINGTTIRIDGAVRLS